MFDEKFMEEIASRVAAKLMQHATHPRPPRRYLNTSEAAEYCGHRTVQAFRSMVRRHRIRRCRHGNTVRFDIKDLDDYMTGGKEL